MFPGHIDEFLDGHGPFDQMHLQVFVPLSAQMIGLSGKGLLFSRLSLCITAVISGKGIVLFFLDAGRILRVLCLQPMGQYQVVGHDRPQKGKGARPVRQYMEHLQVDTPPVIIDAVEELSAPVVVDRGAGGLVLRLYDGRDIAAVQIIPEQSLAQDAGEMRIVRHGPVQGLLQQVSIHLFLQFACDPEDTGVRAPRRRGNDLRRIIQFIPLRAGHTAFLSCYQSKIL